MKRYPQVRLSILTTGRAVDLIEERIDVALRVRQPVQPDLIQRKLFAIHYHLYASSAYLKRHGNPETIEELDNHRIITFGSSAPVYLRDMNWLETAGRPLNTPRRPCLKINSVLAIKRAVQRGVGVALLPDYLIDGNSDLVQLIPEADVPAFDCYFVYPEEMRNTARVKVFRDFLISKAERWTF